MANLFIKKLQPHAALDRAAAAAIEKATATARRVRAGTDLIREGDGSGPVLVMLDGWAMRYNILPGGSRQITAFMMPGDFGDLHVSARWRIDHSIKTLTASLVVAIPGPEMEQLQQQHPAVARAMYIAQLAEKSMLRSWIVSMGLRSSIERVAHFLSELYVRAHWLAVQKTEIELPLSQAVLADALGLTPVHINRTLGKLREVGIIALRRGCIIIVRPQELAGVAGFDENYLHRRSSSLD